MPLAAARSPCCSSNGAGAPSGDSCSCVTRRWGRKGHHSSRHRTPPPRRRGSIDRNWPHSFDDCGEVCPGVPGTADDCGVMTTAAKPKAAARGHGRHIVCNLLSRRRSWRAVVPVDTTSTTLRGMRHSKKSATCCWHRRLPTRSELGDLQAQLVAGRPLPEPVLRSDRALPAGSASGHSNDGMDLLRTLTSALSHYDPDDVRQLSRRPTTARLSD